MARGMSATLGTAKRFSTPSRPTGSGGVTATHWGTSSDGGGLRNSVSYRMGSSLGGRHGATAITPFGGHSTTGAADVGGHRKLTVYKGAPSTANLLGEIALSANMTIGELRSAITMQLGAGLGYTLRKRNIPIRSSQDARLAVDFFRGVGDYAIVE